MKSNKKRPVVTSKKLVEKPYYPGNRKHYILLLIIVLISFIVYLPALKNDFFFDDEQYIKNNPLVFFINSKEIFSHYISGNYHPLTILIFAIEYQFFGLQAEGYHTVNLMLHLLNTILVFQLVLSLSKKKEVAFVASLLFGIHPLHVESVAWIAELKDLLYTFFFLASWLFYLRYLKEPKKKFYLFCLLLFLLSLLSKAMAASLPVILLLTDYFKGRKFTIKVWLEKIPFFGLAIIFGLIAIIAQKVQGALQYLDVYSLGERIVFACYGFITYWVKLLNPSELSVYYPFPLKSGSGIPGWFYIYPFIFLALVVSIFYSLRYTKKIIFGFAIFLITVFLVLQLLPVGGAIMADRYTYMPSIGAFFLAGEGFYWLWMKKKINFRFRWLAVLLLGAAVIFLSVKTFERCTVWKNGMTLWNDVITKYQTVYIAYNNRGNLLVNENRYKEALDDYNNAIKLKPNYTEAYYNRGCLFKNEKKYPDALTDFKKAIELRPDWAKSYESRGQLWAAQNRYTEAINDYNKAIELKPDFTEAYNNRGILQMNNKRYTEALRDFNTAISFQKYFAIGYCNRGNLFMNMEKYEEAKRDVNTAISLEPNFGEPYYIRGILLIRENKFDLAIIDFKKVIALNPGFRDAYYNLAVCEYSLGKKNEACLNLQRAINMGMQQAINWFSQICK